MGRFKTHEERAAKKMRKNEERKKAQKVQPKKSPLSFYAALKKRLFGKDEK